MSETAQSDQFAFMTEQEQGDWYLSKAVETLTAAAEGEADPLHSVFVALDYLYYLSN